MGDRANVIIIHEKRQANVLTPAGKVPAMSFYLGVGIYTHWCGSGLHLMVQNAVRKAKPRWDDDQYFTRIVFDDLLTQAGDHDKETGWGVYPYMEGSSVPESSYRDIYINLYDNTVSIGDRKWNSLQEFVNEKFLAVPEILEENQL